MFYHGTERGNWLSSACMFVQLEDKCRNDPPVKYAVQERDEQHSQMRDDMY